MYVFAFDHPHGVAPGRLAPLLGAKGAALAEMTSVLDLPVPPGFTITTDAGRVVAGGGWPDGLDDEIAEHVARLEAAVGRRFGDPDEPLLVSVRSGADRSMPGMMDTVLDVGLGDRSVRGLARRTGGERFAWDCYRRLIDGFSRVVIGIDVTSELGATEVDVDVDERRAGCERALAAVAARTGETFPQDPAQQLHRAIAAVFSSWGTPRAAAYRARQGIADDPGTAVSVQTMVFGNRDDRSGTGVASTRDPSTGEARPVGDFLVRAQGDDVVAGAHATDGLDGMAARFPERHAELLDVFARLEAHHRDLCEVEFTIETDRLWVLQARIGTRTGAAALRMAVEMVDRPGWHLARDEALLRVTGEHLRQVMRPGFDAGEAEVMVVGRPASPGAAVGQACFSAAAAIDAADRGDAVILVRAETSPEDVPAMGVAAGVLTATGGPASHAAVVARGWGIPAVVGAAIHIDGEQFTAGGVTVEAGALVSIDGSTGEVAVGARRRRPAGQDPALVTLLGWADDAVAERGGAPVGDDPAARLAAAHRALGLGPPSER
ncbi:MAG: PEP/pyruvate-binding domain-containing protein [Acidimicrobiales bacterium]